MGFVDFGTNSLLKIKYDELPLIPNDFDIIIFQRSSFWEYFPGLEKENCSVLISFSERRSDEDKKALSAAKLIKDKIAICRSKCKYFSVATSKYFNTKY